jgi:general secretion pathway protein C
MNIQRIISVINLVLLTLGAYFGAGLCYRIWGLQVQPSQLNPVETAKAATASQAAAQPYSAYRPILQRDLFKTQKTAALAPQTEKLNVEEMEETKLQLKLWGTVTGDARQSYAVIEDVPKREQNLYRVGDSIQDAAVKAILREKVILTVNGQDEVLAMEEIQKSGPPQRPFPRGPRPIAGAPAGPTRTQRVSLRRTMIDEAIQDVSKLMTEIKIQPHESGLSLSDIKPNSIFRRMGLRNGDVLKSVDGQEIRSVDDALKLYESLKSADNVNVVLQRRGSDRTINYNIR